MKDELVRLSDIGITGSGHMMMLENNSDEIATFLAGWLQRNGIP